MHLSSVVLPWILASSSLLPAPADEAKPKEPAPAATEKPPEGKPEDRSGPTTAKPPATTPEEARKRGRGWNDRRRTVHSYLGNLGYNTLRPLARPNWPAAVAGFGLAGAATLVDTDTVDFFERHHAKTFGTVGATIGGTGAVAGLAIGLFSAGRIFPGDRFRSATYDASQAMIITTAYTFALKAATNRSRPDDSNNQSFPSGHASLAFSWCTVLERHYGPKVGIPAYTLASAIAVSRLAHRKHYLSDIVAGATIGHLVGRTVARYNSRPAAGVPAKPVVPGPAAFVIPTFGPKEAGLQLSVLF
jgi:membrane-associated phospholipid phosphatase